MNALPGIIADISSVNNMSLVKVKLKDGSVVNTVILETPETLSYLKLNHPVKILFKETELILSQSKIETSSLDNVLSGVIKKFNAGELLARVEIEFNSVTINSVITKHAFDRLTLKANDPIFVVINSSEIMLSE